MPPHAGSRAHRPGLQVIAAGHSSRLGNGSAATCSKAAGVTVIASNHDFEKTPDLATLLQREAQARALGADVVKFAFRLHSAEDMMVGVELLRRATGPLAVMGMGALGAVSRLLYVQHGSCLIYGYLGQTPTSPGQWSAALCKAALASTAIL